MTYNPSCAFVTVGNQRYQVLKPQAYATIVTGQRVTGQDDEGNDILEDMTEQVALPLEWDEAATMALVYRDHGEPAAATDTEPEIVDIN